MSELVSRSRIACTIGEIASQSRKSEASITVISHDHAGPDTDFAIRMAETLGYWAVVVNLDPINALIRDPSKLRDDLAEKASYGKNPLLFVIDATRYDANDPVCVKALDVIATQMRGEWSISGQASLYVIAGNPVRVAQRIGETLGRTDWTGFIRY